MPSLHLNDRLGHPEKDNSMCMDLYIGTKDGTVDLTVAESESGLWITALEEENIRVRRLMELESVFQVGSFMGCTCGLYFGEWSKADPRENHEKRLVNVAHFRQILSDHSESIVRIMTLEDYNFKSLKEFPVLKLDLDSMTPEAKEFSLDTDCVYELCGSVEE